MAVVRISLPSRSMRNLADRAEALGLPRLTRELRNAITRHGCSAELTADEFRAVMTLRHPPTAAAELAKAAIRLADAEESDRVRKQRARDAGANARARFGIGIDRPSDRERRFHKGGS